MRTCRWILIAAIAIAGCGFDPSGLGTPPVIGGDAAQIDAAPVVIDAGSIEIDATPVVIDARPPDATPEACGGEGESCCAKHGNDPQCDDGSECTNGKCTACGALFESCCDPGATCNFGICVSGGCVSLSQ
ncbi:MAG TPA: hypothetical protein VL463_29430 [Kofleriaceae bacterium]|nr:hypothetical protein [Kofleriaceae bacterium]